MSIGTQRVTITTRRANGKWPLIVLKLPGLQGASDLVLRTTPRLCIVSRINASWGLYPQKTTPGIYCDPINDSGATLYLTFNSEQTAAGALKFLKSNVNGALEGERQWAESCVISPSRFRHEFEPEFNLYRATPDGVLTAPKPNGEGILLGSHPGAFPVWLLNESVLLPFQSGEFVLFADASNGYSVYLVWCGERRAASGFVKRLRKGGVSCLFRPVQVFRFQEDDPVEAADEWDLRDDYTPGEGEWPQLINAVRRYWDEFGAEIKQLREKARQCGGAE
jgi:hypothetical protein